MKKYRIVGKFHLGDIGDVVELHENEGDAWVGYGRLEKVTTKKPANKTRKPRTKKSE